MKGNPMNKIILSAIALFLLIGGIGLAQPTRRSGSSPIERASPVLWNSDGSVYLPANVGIGTTAASSALSVVGDISATGEVSGATLQAGGTSGVSEIRLDANDTIIQSLGDTGIYLGDLNVADKTRLDVDGFIYADKNVGIGTTSALASLQVGDGVPGSLKPVDVDGSVYIQKGLEVEGAIYLGAPVTASVNERLVIRSRAVNSYPLQVYAYDGSSLMGVFERSTGEGFLYVYDAAGSAAVVLSGRSSIHNSFGNNVGIGTTTASASLVVGTAADYSNTGAGDVYFKNDLEVDGQGIYFSAATTVGKALCLTNIGHLGYCKDQPGATGGCTCIGK